MADDRSLEWLRQDVQALTDRMDARFDKVDARLDDLDRRLRKLESWQSRVMGIAAVVAAGVSAAWQWAIRRQGA